MKKILYIHHAGNIGGAGVSAYNTINLLSTKYNVVVLCPSSPRDFSDFLKSKQINVRTYDIPIGSVYYISGGVPIYSPVFVKGIVNIFRYRKSWEAIVKDEAPDLVVVNSKILSWFSLVTENLKVKSVCFVRETRKYSFLNIWNSIHKYLLNKFTKVIFISNYDEKCEGLEKNKATVVPNFLDLSEYVLEYSKKDLLNKFNLPHYGFNILFVGGMAKIKGVDVAINSLKYLTNYNVNLLIVGADKFSYRAENSILDKLYNLIKKRYENKIIKSINKNSLKKSIFFLGVQENMAGVYALADVLIFPANYPHQARPAFEAGALRKTVIMPDFENTEEYVKNNTNGLTFKRRNSRSLAEKIAYLIDNPEVRTKLGDNNYENTVRNHVREVSERKIHEIIKEII
ncbi:MAG: hypothetical protein PWQ06_315 [Anaerophaga sp.]|nr:hypothetical protein [Anaerophaga sp.]